MVKGKMNGCRVQLAGDVRGEGRPLFLCRSPARNARCAAAVRFVADTCAVVPGRICGDVAGLGETYVSAEHGLETRGVDERRRELAGQSIAAACPILRAIISRFENRRVPSSSRGKESQ